MPRYFFHTTGDRPSEDEDGVILRDDVVARHAVVRAFGEALRDAKKSDPR